MNRRLILLNVALAAVLIFAGVQWRNQYEAKQARERAMRNAKPALVQTAPMPPLPNPPPLMATGYNEVAQKLLLHPSRNPDLPPVVVEPPPPPPPMPPLPKYHGSMNLDGEPVAILSIGNNAAQEVKIGAPVGDFKLLDVNTRDITFQWKDQQVRKTLNEILDRSQVEAASNNNASNNAAAAAAPAPPQIKSQIGPVGDTNGFGTKSCDPNDSYADGSVVNGFRKASVPTPFGKACRWEPVGR